MSINVNENRKMEPPAVVIAVRTAHAADAESLHACLKSAFEPFRPQYTPDAFRDTVPSPEAMRERMLRMTVYAAVAPDGEIVGTVASEVEGKQGHLRGMAVLPSWQGHSIAESLLRTAENDLLTAGCRHVTLDTTAPLKRAIGFYRKNGFFPSGRITDFFGMPRYEYVKPLTQ